MEIQLTVRNVRPSRLLERHVRLRVQQALARVAAQVQRVTVVLADRNRRRGGGDKQCQIHVHLADGLRVKSQYIRADIFRAVDRAVSLAAAQVAGLLKVRVARPAIA